MDTSTQSEIILRRAGFETWTETLLKATGFESAALMGFVFEFDSAESLLDNWEARQNSVLTRHASALRKAGEKAWNVYSAFLTAEVSHKHQREIEKIEENFRLTRKIARTAIRTPDDLERALLPLVGIRARPKLGVAAFEDRLQARVKDVAPDAASAIIAMMNDATPEEVARILGSD